MQLDFIIERLKPLTPAPLRLVGGAADLDAAMRAAVALPVAFVIPLSERSESAPLLGRWREEDRCEFGVLLCVSNLRDARGAQALEQLAPLRAAVRAALSGWAPVQCAGRAITKRAGKLLRLDGDARLWWMDHFDMQLTYEGA